ncbi:MAG: lysine--tRNA ligase [Planctomycetes bacterium]|nr:lysine--tRNA ligase [Planctomycetota bacterium]
MNEQISDRKAKLDKMKALGIDPYGARHVDLAHHADIRQRSEELGIESGQIRDGEGARFRAAGRVMLSRRFGNLIFLTVRDRTGDLQYGLSKKAVQQGWEVAKLLDLGDTVGVEGQLGRTKTGELTLWGNHLTLLGKAIRPMPEKWHGLTDVEARYRRRYVDLFTNPESRDVFIKRARIIDYARDVLRRREFIEVETPLLQPIYGGAAARPFLTHHNTLDVDLYLRISPELYLKRCLVGGLERIYELGRCFRNEGISPRHNPEFTMLELYQAYGDYHDMMDICEEFIAGAARDVIGSTKIKFGEREIDYAPPWPRLKYADAFHKRVGLTLDDIPAIRARARELHNSGELKADEGRLDDAVVIHELFDHYVEEALINPTFILDWPAPLCPLTKRDPDNPGIALRFELFINGMEIGNAYTELNDPAIQRETLSQQLRGEEDETMAVMDEDYVEALEYGMPPAGGLGIGIDRVVMLLTGSPSIRDVILFPLQRAQRLESDVTQRAGEAPAET